MAKVLVVSDVHGAVLPLRWILENETADAMFFLGDGLRDLVQAIDRSGKPAYPIYRVAGNCDLGFHDPMEGLVPLGGVLFFYTHGHRYGVKLGSERLAETAAARGADVALFGHTHNREYEPGTDGAAAVFNPGSLRDGRCYGVISVQNGSCKFDWKRVPEF